jgi:Holliday junction resolvase RusA-like endonuclease
MLTIELPFPVSVNSYWQIAGRRLIKTKRARAYIMEVTLYWLNAKMLGAQAFGEDETLALSIAVHYPIRRGPDCDIDNLSKVLIDAMETAGIYQNDRQIRFVQISREEAKDKTVGSVRVNIKACPHEMELNDRIFRVEEVHNE